MGLLNNGYSMNEVSRATLITRRYVSKPFTAEQSSNLKKYCRNAKSSSRCWPGGPDLALARELPRVLGLFTFTQPRPRSILVWVL